MPCCGTPSPPSSGAGASSPVTGTSAPCPECELEIVDDAGAVLSSKQTKTVGERIALTVRTRTPGCSISNVKWDISGAIVKNYIDGATSAVVTNIADADRKSITITFYWVDGADGRTAKVDCVCTNCGGAKTKSASVTFDVKAPTLAHLKATTSTVGFDNLAAPSYVQFGLPASGTSGIKWDWKVTVPATVDGWLKDVQVINTTTKQTASGKKQVWTIAGKKVPPGVEQLDTTNPYSMPGDFHATKGFPQKVAKGADYIDDYTSDSPRSPLSGTTAASVSDGFSYYVMYKPDLPRSIWVPVGVAGWYWRFSALLGSSGWTLSGASNAINPTGAATTSFPTYSSNVSSNVWQDE